jgi:hypothetical protein
MRVVIVSPFHACFIVGRVGGDCPPYRNQLSVSASILITRPSTIELQKARSSSAQDEYRKHK